MIHYKKGKNVEEELKKENIPIDFLPESYLWMHVRGGTKIPNVIDFVKTAFENGEYRSVVWSGSGGGVVKTISCAEIFKRNYNLHQVTRLSYRVVDEYWEPQMEGLEEIVASRKVPCIHIFQTLDAVNFKTLGYQPANEKTKFWASQSKQVDTKTVSKSSGGESGSTNKGNFRRRQKGELKKGQKDQRSETMETSNVF